MHSVGYGLPRILLSYAARFKQRYREMPETERDPSGEEEQVASLPNGGIYSGLLRAKKLGGGEL
jgi:hypothetical protein